MNDISTQQADGCCFLILDGKPLRGGYASSAVADADMRAIQRSLDHRTDHRKGEDCKHENTTVIQLLGSIGKVCDGETIEYGNLGVEVGWCGRCGALNVNNEWMLCDL